MESQHPVTTRPSHRMGLVSPFAAMLAMTALMQVREAKHARAYRSHRNGKHHGQTRGAFGGKNHPTRPNGQS